jgi:hypothetical protein
MKTFRIDSTNDITAWATSPEAGEANAPTFTSAEQMDELPSRNKVKLEAVWNELAGVIPVRKFVNRKIGIRRIWAQIQRLTPVEPRPAAEARADAEVAPRRRWKQAVVVELIKREDGATLEEIVAATNWQRHTVRGFIAGRCQKTARPHHRQLQERAASRTRTATQPIRWSRVPLARQKSA